MGPQGAVPEWGRQIGVSKWSNGQMTHGGILLIRHLGTNFNEISIEILTFSFIKMRLKVSSAKWRPFCLGLNVLIAHQLLWQNMEATVSIFQESPLTGEPHERLFHIQASTVTNYVQNIFTHLRYCDK